MGQGELHPDQEDKRGIETSISRNTHQLSPISDHDSVTPPQVAELYEDLKKRASQFNMHVIENPLPMDYSSLHKQRFILQVRPRHMQSFWSSTPYFQLISIQLREGLTE